MNFLPYRRKHSRMNAQPPGRVVCPGHLKFVRGFQCSIAGKSYEDVDVEARTIMEYPHDCVGRIEAHHSTTRGAYGGDDSAVPLCAHAHQLGHSIGWPTFEKRYGVDLGKIAAGLWRNSPHRMKFERAWAEEWPGAGLPYGGQNG